MIKNQDRMQSHTMELPRLIKIGEKNIGDFGSFLNLLNKPKKVSLISGKNVQKVLREKIEKSLKSEKIKFVWHTSKDNQIKSLNIIQKDVKKDNSDLIVGMTSPFGNDSGLYFKMDTRTTFLGFPTIPGHRNHPNEV